MENMKLMFLGDIHGNFNIINQYVKMYDIKDTHIIQVGDFGVGFSRFEKEKRMLEMYHTQLVNNNVHVWAIRGNHDYKPYFDNDPFGFTNIHLVADYTVLNLADKKILCIGGAVSVDREFRYTKKQKQGIYENNIGIESWWPDEIFVLDIDKLKELRDINIMVTHTCPDYCPPDNTFGLGYFVEGIIKETGDNQLRTDLNFERNQVTQAFAIVKMNNDIEFAYYGHFHKSDNINILGTKHRLLKVNELWEERD
jgi:DNA repair exonuclease SbcCD nuclease subunit